MENNTNTTTNELTLEQVAQKTHKVFKKESGILEIMSYVAMFGFGMAVQHILHYKFWNKEFKNCDIPKSNPAPTNPTNTTT